MGEPLGASIPALLEQYADTIVALREAVGVGAIKEAQDAQLEADGMPYDDIFLVRFCVSHKGNVANAAKALTETLLWRIKNAETLAKIALEEEEAIPGEDFAAMFQCAGLTGGNVGGWPVVCIRAGYSNVKALMNTASFDVVASNFHYKNWLQSCRNDKKSRACGRIVKTITVVNLADVSFFAMDTRFFKALGASSRFSSKHFPQLLGKTVFVNCPSWMRVALNSFRPFQPQSAIDKQSMCQATNTSKDDIKKCPFMSKHGSVEEIAMIPEFLGGKAVCPAHLVPLNKREDCMVKVHVPARDKVVVHVPCCIGVVKCTVMVESYGIGVQWTFVNEEGKTDVVLPYEKRKSDGGLIVVKYDVKQEGQLELTLDNGFSILRGKNVEYQIEQALSTSPTPNTSRPPSE